jgi:hypothetical protein
MKKATGIFFLLIYSLTTVGAVVNLHYCMGRYASWSLSYERVKNCQTCGMTKAKSRGCCRDELKQVKTKKEHLQQQVFGYGKSFQFDSILLPWISEHRVNFSGISKIYPIIHAPPGLYAIKTHILHCIFLI